MRKLFAILIVLIMAVSVFAVSAEETFVETEVETETIAETSEETTADPIKYVATNEGYASIDNAVIGKTDYYDALNAICNAYDVNPVVLFAALGRGELISTAVGRLFGLSESLARTYEEYFLEKCRVEIISPNASNQYTVFQQYLFAEDNFYTDDTAEVTEAEYTAVETTEEVTEAISIQDLENAIRTAENRDEAILNIAALFGVSQTEAEKYLDAFIDFGDEHFAESSTWQNLKTDIQENRKFWILLIVVGAALIILVGNLVVMIINKSGIATTKRGVLSYAESAKGMDASAKKVAEDAGNYWASVETRFNELLEKYDNETKLASEYRANLQATEQEVENLTADCADKNLANYRANRLTLEILYLITRRMELPMVDRSVIDKWYAEGTAELDKLVGAKDSSEINAINQQLKEVGDVNDD